jgi:hypothetical protein
MAGSWWTEPIVTKKSPEWQKVLYGMTPWFSGGEYLSPQQILGSPELQLAGLGAGQAGTAYGAVKAAIPSIPKAAAQVAPAVAGVATKVATGAKGVLAGIPAWMGKHKLATGALAGLGSYLAWINRPGQTPAEQSGMVNWTSTTPTAAPTPTPSALPEPGAMGGEEPKIVDVGGQRFWYDPGTGSWNLLPAGQGDDELAREQMAQQMQLAQMQQQWQMEQLNRQYELERQMQLAGATQDMATMYAQDPYKYWAQMGQLTPEAVARLTGGAVQAGQPFKGTPLSYPSMQWWANLLPSEQQQIYGALNWMGINPEDYQAMQQRMIPGLGSRQMEPVWAR